DEAEMAVRLIVAIWRFWQIRGYLFEADRRIPRVLSMSGVASLSPILRARAFGAAGSVAYWRGDSEAMRVHYGVGLDEARRSGDRGALADALYNFGFAPTAPSDV